MADSAPFWKTKSLAEMSREQWESLCDGCGRCCLNKLEDEDTGRFLYTRAACKLLDLDTCRCTDYPNRKRRVPDCIRLTPARLQKIDWLPPTCAYRLVSEGKDLLLWHHLVCGDREQVHKQRISQAGRMLSENSVAEDEFQESCNKAKALMRAAEAHFAPQLATPHFALSLEVQEISAPFSWKTNAIHPRLRTR
jgi:uncharacterized cysteine cluster protein YcgN (CxxCxxCC family)